MNNQTIEQLQQDHAQAVARLRRVDAAIERSSIPVPQEAYQAAQQALGGALAAVALGEQPEGDVDKLREALCRTREDLEDAAEGRELRLEALQRRRVEAQEAVQSLHGELTAAKSSANSAAMDSMQKEIHAIPASMPVTERMAAFRRIAEKYTKHPGKIEEMWNNRWD